MRPRSITDVLASRFGMSARLVASVIASTLFLGTVAPAFADDAKPADAKPAASSGKSETYDERDDRQMARMWGWMSIGIGGGAALIALGTSIWMLHDKSVRDDNCDANKVCNTAGLGANSEMGQLVGWNIGAYAVAAVGFGVGAFLILTHPSDKEMGTQVGIAPTGSGTGFVLRSSF
jgi:hypothetical protein